jgi:electron transfer flavoprotein beta subunit
MKLVVLLKRLPDLVEDLEVDSSGKALDTEFLKFTLNEFDDYALEEGLLLKEATDGELTVVALDGEDVDKMLFTALAKGADRAMKIQGADEVSGNRGLAKIFAQVVSSLPHDLVMTGVQSAEDLDGQLGPMVAAMLDEPCVEVVTQVAVSDGGVSIHKEYSGGVVAEFELTTPAVIGIQASQQAPRYAPVSKVRQVQESATIETVSGQATGDAAFSVVQMTPPEAGEGAQMLGDVEELVKVLESKGVI